MLIVLLILKKLMLIFQANSINMQLAYTKHGCVGCKHSHNLCSSLWKLDITKYSKHLPYKSTIYIISSLDFPLCTLSTINMNATHFHVPHNSYNKQNNE